MASQSRYDAAVPFVGSKFRAWAGRFGVVNSAVGEGTNRRITPARDRHLALVGAAVVAASLAATGSAAAQAPPSHDTPDPVKPSGGPPPPSRVVFSPYEQETIAQAIAQVGGGEIELEPDGKPIESIEIVRFEVVEKRDVPYDTVRNAIPKKAFGNRFELVVGEESADEVAAKTLETAVTWSNRVHYVTRDMIVRREMLFSKGDVYRTQAVQETARNLRVLPQIAHVVYVPLKGKKPGAVRLVYATKDLWSLRLSYDVGVTPGGVEYLTFVPQETNLLGLHHTVAGTFVYQPESYTVGASYRVPRFGYSRIGASAGVNAYINRQTGSPEGSAGSVSVGQPLWSTRTPWAWSANAGWTDAVARRYSNAKLALYDARATGAVRDNIPFQYKTSTVSAGAGVTRSFGWEYKNDLSAGFSASFRSNKPFDLSRYDPRAADEFVRRNIPVGEDRVGPNLQWHSYTTRFHAITDFATFALQEEYRLGHEVYVNVYPVTRALGSTRDVLGGYAGAQYTIPLGDGLARASVESVTEYELRGDGSGGNRLSDASISGAVRIVSPKTRFGRVVFDGAMLNRYENYLNRQSVLGGDDRLRGYPSNYYSGSDVILGNLEFRTRPVRLLSLQVGGVAFFDAGDTAFGWKSLSPKQSAGFGIRTLIPWLNRVVFRGDFGFPLNRTQAACPTPGTPCKIDPYNFYFSFEQAFGFGSISP